MSQDTTRRSSPEELAPPTASAAFLPCSDCRTAMRQHYYALDSRPVCPKCRVGYKQRIEFAKGPGSLARLVRHAGGTALAGVAVLCIIGWAVPIFRVIPAVALAWFIAKAVNKASGDYYLRRNQWIGAVMLYLAIGLAGSIPATVNAFSGPSRAQREAEVVTEAEADEALEALTSFESTTADAEKGEATLRRAGNPQRPQSLNETAGGQLQQAGPVVGIAVFVILTLIMPFLAILGAGMYAAGLSLFALIGAFYKFREWTSDGVSYDVTGPFRVGTGPIATTW